MGEGQAKLDLLDGAASVQCTVKSREAGEVGSASRATCLVVDGLGVASSLQRGPDGGRTRSESCTGDAKGVHDDVVGRLVCTAVKQS